MFSDNYRIASDMHGYNTWHAAFQTKQATWLYDSYT